MASPLLWGRLYSPSKQENCTAHGLKFLKVVFATPLLCPHPDPSPSSPPLSSHIRKTPPSPSHPHPRLSRWCHILSHASSHLRDGTHCECAPPTSSSGPPPPSHSAHSQRPPAQTRHWLWTSSLRTIL